MVDMSKLPVGQQEIEGFPRFGLTKFANRFPSDISQIDIEIGGDLEESNLRIEDLATLNRVDYVADFHCVTTWTKRDVSWSGFRFHDVCNYLLRKQSRELSEYKFAIFRGQDGYRVGLFLDDLLAPDVLLADRLEGEELSIAHGAPVRLIAPAHYGYKSIKHVSRIEFWRQERDYRRAAFKFMDHPRARVVEEERGRYFPGWFLRILYRPLIRSTVAKFESALTKHQVPGNDSGPC